MIIDTHSQIRTAEALEGVSQGILGKNESIFHRQQEHSLDDTVADMEKAGVDKSVLVAVDAGPYMRISNDLVWRAVEKHLERFIGFASVDPRKGREAEEELLRATEKMNMKGVKFIPHLLHMFPNDERFYPIYEIAQEKGLPVLFHSGTAFHRGMKIKYSHPIHLDDVACDFPMLKIIIAHFGFPWYVEALALAQRHDFVYFNIAGWRPRYIPEMVIRYMNGPLAEKVLFGSDFPLVSRSAMIKELGALNLKPSTLENLLSKNPQRVIDCLGQDEGRVSDCREVPKTL